MHADAPGHDDSPDASRRAPNSAHQHPLAGRPRGTIEPPELRDVVAFSVQFGSHNEPQLAVVHQADLLNQRAVAPPDGRYSTAPVPDAAARLSRPAESLPTVRHYTATLHEIVEHTPVPPSLAAPVASAAAEAAPRASRVPLAVAGVVVTAAVFGYLLGRQQPMIDFARLPPTSAGPSAKAAMGPGPALEVPAVPAAPATPTSPAVAAHQAGPAPAMDAPAAPLAKATPDTLSAKAAPDAPTAKAAPTPRDIASPTTSPPLTATPQVAVPARAKPAAAVETSVAAAAPAAAARVAATPIPVPIEPARPVPAPPCTEKVAALGLCDFKP